MFLYLLTKHILCLTASMLWGEIIGCQMKRGIIVLETWREHHHKEEFRFAFTIYYRQIAYWINLSRDDQSEILIILISKFILKDIWEDTRPEKKKKKDSKCYSYFLSIILFIIKLTNKYSTCLITIITIVRLINTSPHNTFKTATLCCLLGAQPTVTFNWSLLIQCIA